MIAPSTTPYLTNAPFVSGYTITGGHPFSVTRGYEDHRDLLASIDSKWNSVSLTRYDYTHNARYQRQTGKQSGSAFSDLYVTGSYSAIYNHYSYNPRRELETAAAYRGDTPSATPSSTDELPGRRFEYRYDSIGNRRTAGPTGSDTGVDALYTTNELNQYVQRENNTVSVLGVTGSLSANVSVNGALSTGQNDHVWAADFVPNNLSGAVKGTAKAYAAIPGGGSGGLDLIRTETKPYFVPKWEQTFAYDEDGNLLSDSVWDYTYDAENRLVSMETRSEVIGSGMLANADARKLLFTYDYQGPRVRKIVYDGWNGSTYSATPLADTKYLYDGWNLIAEFDVNSSLSLDRSYTWGLDLTGSLTASGGVGGLLQVYDADFGSGKTLLPTYDGNGNVAAMVNASDGTLEATYEYDPFGNLLRKEGDYAAANPFRFSTKYTDNETDLVYYGKRYYSPSLGRFINRDPIEEQGGINLYTFVGNNAVNAWDYLGMKFGDTHADDSRIPYGYYDIGDGEHALPFGYSPDPKTQMGYKDPNAPQGPRSGGEVAYGGPGMTDGGVYMMDPYETNGGSSGGGIRVNNYDGGSAGTNNAPGPYGSDPDRFGGVVIVNGSNPDNSVIYDQNGMMDPFETSGLRIAPDSGGGTRTSGGDMLNNVAVVAGTVAAAAGSVKNVQDGSMGFWVGKNRSIQPTSWGGNGATGGRLKFAGKMAGAAKTVGNFAGAVGMGVSAFQGYNAFKNNDTNGMIRSVADMAAGGIGFAGPYGSAFSIGYFMGQRIDSWTGATDKFARWYTGYP